MSRKKRHKPDRQPAGKDKNAPGRPARWPVAVGCLLLFGLAGLCYLNADHEVFYFDGKDVINHLDSPAGQWQALMRRPLRPGGYPLTEVSYALNHQLNRALGLDPYDVSSYLAINILLHAVNGCLIFFLTRRLLRLIAPQGPPPYWIPLAVAVLFVVHPIAASSVAYIMQRRSTQALVFYLLAVWAYLRVRDPADFRRPWQRWLLAAGIVPLYWLAYQSKAMALTLPFALLAVEFILRAGQPKGLRRFVLILLPAGILTGLGLLIFLHNIGRFSFQEGFIVGDSRVTWAVWGHFLTETRAFVHYWKLLLLPLPAWSTIDHDLAVSHQLTDHAAWLAVLLHLALFVVAVVAVVRGYKLIGLGVLWFYITLIPYIILPQTELLVEYKTYFPAVGLMWIVAEILWRLHSRVRTARLTGAVVLVALALMSTTIYRNRIYQSEENLWRDALAKSPTKARPYINLGSTQLQKGHYEEAIDFYRKALKIDPTHSGTHFNIGNALEQVGQPQEAIEHYRQAIEYNPANQLAYLNLARLLQQADQTPQAIYLLERGVRAVAHRDRSQMHLYLGTLLEERGQTDKAMEHYRLAFEADPRQIIALNNLGLLLSKSGRHEQAIAELQKALQLAPDSPILHNSLGEAYRRRGEPDRALTEYQAATRRQPDYFEAHMNAGRILAEIGQPDRAMEHFQAAQRLAPANPYVYLFIGQAMEQLGQGPSAIDAYRRSLALDPDNAAARQALDRLTGAASP